MTNKVKLEPGECYRLYLKPQVYEQLVCLIAVQDATPKGQLTGNFKRLQKVVAEAQIRQRPQERMTRGQRAKWVAEELQELLCEVETLQEEMGDWIEGQKGGISEHTAQHGEVYTTWTWLTSVTEKISEAQQILRKCKFPGWGKNAHEASERRDEKVRANFQARYGRRTNG